MSSCKQAVRKEEQSQVDTEERLDRRATQGTSPRSLSLEVRRALRAEDVVAARDTRKVAWPVRASDAVIA